ncbi:hypothetical protein DL771_007094 [Monosporascus sp. 5C6A]|nr:hypothetical protein DL771_007094 [Monosporascus sp. 5C6A]
MTSTSDSSLCNLKVKAFLEEYKKDETQKQFKDLAEVFRKKCEELLTTKKIKGVVQSRSKGYDSLETKLNHMAKTPEFIKWVTGFDNGGEVRIETQGEVREPEDKAKTPEFTAPIDNLGKPNVSEDDQNSSEYDRQGQDVYEDPDMGDLAGVRVGLFLPGDVLKVAEEIKKNFNVLYTFGTVTDTTRSAVNGRNRDIQRHGDGRWISQGPGEDVHHWEHYGYKSWQVVVEWKRSLPELPENLKSIEAALAPTKVFNRLKVEIQVGTVVSQAWAEVQHNIIYKRPIDIQATPTMRRMIDATNGLAITTDIILTELERSQAQAEKEAERQRRLEKDTPLIMLSDACSKGDHETVTRLLADVVDINAKNHAGWTALHMASRWGHGNVVEELLHNDGIDVNLKREGDWTALHRASIEGHGNVVEELLADRVDVNAKNHAGWTALHMASREGHNNVVEKLLHKDGIDINAKDQIGWTALHTASWWGHCNVVEKLLVNGVDVNVESKGGWMALHLASKKGYGNVVEKLLANRVDVNVKGRGGRTALHMASQGGHGNVVEKLLHKDGIDVNAKDQAGRTALYMASEAGHDNVVERLKAALRQQV